MTVPNIKLHTNPSNGSPADTHRWMDMTKLIATFQDYTNMPKMQASATLKMEAASSSEMSSSTHQIAVSYASRM